MRNFFLKLFLTFAFILCFVSGVFAQEPFSVSSATYDDSHSFLSINSINTQDFKFTTKPNVQLLPDENKVIFDIEPAVLESPQKNIVIDSHKINEISLEQYSKSPDIVRVSISYNPAYNPKNIQLRNFGNTIILNFDKTSVSNFYFQQIYGDNLKGSFKEEILIKEPVYRPQNTFVDQINAAFNLNTTNNPEDYVLSNKNLLLKSKYYISDINFNSVIPVIEGIGSYSLTKPILLSNPDRIAFDIPNSVVNPSIRNKEIQFNETDSIKIGQFTEYTSRIVITSPNARYYMPVLYADTQTMSLWDTQNVYSSELFNLKSNIKSVKSDRSQSYESLKFVFDNPVVLGIKRTNSNIELTMLNVVNYDEDGIKQAIKSTLFSEAKIFNSKNHGVKFIYPVVDDDLADIHLGSDGKTLRIRKKVNKLHFSPEQEFKTPEIVIPQIPNRDLTKKYIVIDPGHGGSDCGAIRDNIYEKDITLEISKKVADLLKQKGYIVEMTRNTDKTVSLQERVDFSESVYPDIFVSIHVNSSNSDTPSGIETHYYKDNSITLAKYIHASMINNINSKDRGLFKSKFYVINHTTAPAVLVEIGFMSNPTERAQILSTGRKNATAKAIAEGIDGYFKK